MYRFIIVRRAIGNKRGKARPYVKVVKTVLKMKEYWISSSTSGPATF